MFPVGLQHGLNDVCVMQKSFPIATGPEEPVGFLLVFSQVFSRKVVERGRLHRQNHYPNAGEMGNRSACQGFIELFGRMGGCSVFDIDIAMYDEERGEYFFLSYRRNSALFRKEKPGRISGLSPGDGGMLLRLPNRRCSGCQRIGGDAGPSVSAVERAKILYPVFIPVDFHGIVSSVFP